MGILDRWAVRRVSRLQAQEKATLDIEENVLRRNAPYMSAYRIANGYVLSMGSNPELLATSSNSRLVYCKDHKEIADQLVAHEARKQMKVPEQMEMDFGTSTITTTKIITY